MPSNQLLVQQMTNLAEGRNAAPQATQGLVDVDALQQALAGGLRRFGLF